MISVTVYKDGPVLIQNGNTLLRAHNVTDALTRWPGSKRMLAYRQEVAMLLNEATEAYGQVTVAEDQLQHLLAAALELGTPRAGEDAAAMIRRIAAERGTR